METDPVWVHHFSRNRYYISITCIIVVHLYPLFCFKGQPVRYRSYYNLVNKKIIISIYSHNEIWLKKIVAMTKLSVDMALLKAKSHAKMGEFEEAQKLYQSVLKAFPKNKAAQKGLAALNKLKQFAATQSPPQEVINQLVNMYNSGQLVATVEQAQALTDQYPKAFIIWNILGAAHKGLGKSFEASQAFKKVTKLNPTYADGFNNLGTTLKEQGKLEEAVEAFEKAIFLKPDYAEAYYNMGITLKGQGKLEEAIEAYEKALAIKPDYAEAYNNMGNALKDQGKLDEAIGASKKALSLKPDYAEAYNNMGVTLSEQDKLEEAIEAYEKALAIKPDYVDAYYNMGIALKEQGKLEEAIEALNKALSLKPDYADAYNSMGVTLNEQGKLEEAIEAYEKALAIKPDYAEAFNNSSYIYNLQGKLKKGFELYEWRIKKKVDKTTRAPRKNLIWNGSASVKEKNFLVYAEQGLGDTIQFCRYLPMLEQKGAKVIFKVEKKLHALLRTLNKNIFFTNSIPDESQIEFESPLLSLPYLFKTKLKTIPSATSYLETNHNKVSLWKKYFKQNTFKVGICWQGSKSKIDVGRSFPLYLFKSISALPNVELISLHKGEGERQIKDISFNLTTLGDSFDTGENAFIDTAAIMANCDLIITSDTAIAHLAGALGCPTWIALKYIPDWRWMLDRRDSPWYPSVTLYRQKQRDDWEYVFEEIYKDLNLWLEQERRFE